MSRQGLTSQAAGRLLEKFGLNEIPVKKRVSSLRLFLSQFANFLVAILIVASLISFLLGDFLDALFILLIVILNGLLGFIQEFKAEKAIEALKKITLSKVRVLRDGGEVELDSRFLVPGDLVFLEEGSKIPADGNLTEAHNLEVNEASLTGESLPVAKEAEADDERSLVFSGTVATRGRGRIEITATGRLTRFGKIAENLAEIKEGKTPLQIKLEKLGKELSFVGLMASIFVFLTIFSKEKRLFDAFSTSVSLAVAAVPEGLPAIITITLAVGAQRMSKRKAIVRRMVSIETLGSVTAIATDKTGTLTRNEMSVRKVGLDGNLFSLRDLEGKALPKTFLKMVEIGSVCNTASLILQKDHGRFGILGDSTEGALLLLAKKFGIDPIALRESGAFLEEFPFEAGKRLMSVVWSGKRGDEVLTKGAPESVVSRCRWLLIEGEVNVLTDERQTKIRDEYQSLASEGLRVLALSYKGVREYRRGTLREAVENEQIFVGLIGIADPPREKVRESIEMAKGAGVKVYMITGDNPLTAYKVGEEIGLIEEGDEVLTGDQLDLLNDEELEALLSRVKIFARTTPEHKLRLVRALQDLGHITVVTGDGVNDILALKQADVGVAMGITGTDVAKETADVVITDDNFSSIVTAVEEGRTIFDNMAKSIVYLTSCNLGEVLVIVLSTLLSLPLPLLPVQILWMNLVTDGLPALALSLDEKTRGVMKRPPRSPRTGILSSSDFRFVFLVGLLVALATLAPYALSLRFLNLSLSRTLAFSLLVLYQMVMAFVVRRNRNIFSNKFLFISVLAVLSLQLLILTAAFLSAFLGVARTPWS